MNLILMQNVTPHRPLNEGDEHSSPSLTQRAVNKENPNKDQREMHRRTEGDKHSSPPTQSKAAEEPTTEWSDINEVVESDFLISPGDIYPNRKVFAGRCRHNASH